MPLDPRVYFEPGVMLELSGIVTPSILEFIEERATFHLGLSSARQADRHAMDAMELGAGILALAKAEQEKRREQ